MNLPKGGRPCRQMTVFGCTKPQISLPTSHSKKSFPRTNHLLLSSSSSALMLSSPFSALSLLQAMKNSWTYSIEISDSCHDNGCLPNVVRTHTVCSDQLQQRRAEHVQSALKLSITTGSNCAKTEQTESRRICDTGSPVKKHQSSPTTMKSAGGGLMPYLLQ